MEKMTLTLVLLGILMLGGTLSYGQSINIANNHGGVVDYKVTTVAKNTLIFTLYGDGHFGTQSIPKHKFAPNTAGYDTKAYLVEPYDTNPPTIVSVNTDTTKTGVPYSNPIARMTGEVDVLLSWCPATGFENFFILAFRNLTYPYPINGCIDFHYNTNEIDVDEPNILEYNNWVFNKTHGPSTKTGFNKKFNWQFSNLHPNETRYVYIPAEVFLKLKDKLNIYASYAINCSSGQGDNGGGYGSSGTDATKSFPVTKYSHDPNFKIVDYTCLDLDPTNPIQHLEYTISFYNDGEYFAKDVVIQDYLPPELDPSTFHLIDSEYTPIINITGSLLTFEFPNLWLPGTNQITPQSYTYGDCFTTLTFGICTFPVINPGTCIVNQADITFDTLASVATTIAESCAWDDCSPVAPACTGMFRLHNANSNLANVQKLQTQPNPFQDELTIRLANEISTDENIRVEILDVAGQRRNQFFFDHRDTEKFEKQLYLKDLPVGIYFVVLHTRGERHISKIVKN